MADHCKGCGAEIFPGQRFCRMCGRATGDLPNENAPTQNMPPPDQGPYPGWQGPPRPGPAATAPAQRPDTAPVYPAQQPAYYQGGPVYPPQVYQPPVKSGFKWGWVFAFIGIGIFGTIVFAILLFAARAGRRGPQFTPGPPPPSSTLPGESQWDESTAVVTAGQTIITKSFQMGPGASLSIQNTNGRIHIESWNGPGIEVKVTKSNGSDSMRRRVPILQQMAGNKLSLRSGGGPRNNSVDVTYEIQVPKEMGSVDVSATNGNIRLDGLSGDIKVNSTNGNIDLNDINGTASAENLNGSIMAVFGEVGSGRPMTFKNLNGSIKLTFRSDVNADLRASTTAGSISLDPQWGIEVKKGLIGARADGQIGTGGQPLKVETMNGSISILKAPGTAGH